MQHDFAVSAYWAGERFDEAALACWARDLRGRLKAADVTLGLVFMTPSLFPAARQILEVLRVHARVSLLAGCSSPSVIADGEEIEDTSGLVLGLYHLPGARLRPFRLTQELVEQCRTPADWHSATGLAPSEVNGWLVFADPFQFDAEGWLQGWNKAYAPVPIVGGLATGDGEEPLTQVYLNGEVFEHGGVAMAFTGGVELVSVISQGCTPIGETWTITRAREHFIQEIGNRPAFQVLEDTFRRMDPEQQRRSRGNLFVGLVVNEYLEEFHRGDFLVRNLIGGDPQSGILAVGAHPRPGQTVQFQRRDAEAAKEDITVLLGRARGRLEGRTIYGGCLCSCNGRGYRLFGEPGHDARQVQRHLGPLGLSGFFCNGEIGPVGSRNFLHGYTASLALFVERTANSP